MLVLRGFLDDVLHKVKEQRSRYRGHPESLSEIDFLERINQQLTRKRMAVTY